MLIERSLVKVNIFGDLEMHDQLRDMGRMIVERDEEYLGTRVWNVDSIPSTQSTSKVMNCNEVFVRPCLFHVVFVKCIQSKHVIWFRFY